ncbi:MAG: hypothetical protein ACFE9S_16035 [Candidatus Hermodarchaeota archaeon]
MKKKSFQQFLIIIFISTLMINLPQNLSFSNNSIEDVKSSEKRLSLGNPWDSIRDERPKIITDVVGNVYIVWVRGVENGAKFLYRKWNMTQNIWGSIEQIPPPEGYIHDYNFEVDNVGNLHIVWESSGIFYKSWNFSTQAWNPTQEISDILHYGHGNPSIVSSNSRDVNIAWEGYNYTCQSQVIFLKTWNATLKSWNPSMNITCIKNNTLNRNPSLEIDIADNLHLVYDKRTWDQGKYNNEGIRYKIWNSTSKLWHIGVEISDSGSYPKICLDMIGNKHIAWRGNGISYRKWRNSTKSWSSIERVTLHCDFGVNNYDFSIDHNNKPYAVWSNGRRVVGSLRSDTNSWTTCEVISSLSSEYKDYPTITTDKLGNKHVTWSDWTPYGGSGEDADIFYRCWNLTLGEWMTIKVISSGDPIPYWLFILTDPIFQLSVLGLSSIIIIIVVLRIKKRRHNLNGIE